MTKSTSDLDAQRAIEGRNRPTPAPKPSEAPPAAGPHAEPALVNPDATPGAGAVPPAGDQGDADSTSG
jgi:hypothetical protein